MELRQLKTFQTVATTLSFTRTAQMLDYAQSSVTSQIQTLEQVLGVQLFDRVGKHITLTDPGNRLLGYADKLLNLENEARQVVVGGSEPAGTLTIGATETLCTYRLPKLLYQFKQRYPKVQLVFRPYSWQNLWQGVCDGKLDVAFVLDMPLQTTRLRVEPMFMEPILILAPPDHPLAQLEQVSAIDLQSEQFLLTEPGCSYRELFSHALAEAGVHPTNILEFESVEAIKQCVMVGMGIGVLPAVTVASELAQERLRALNWPIPDFQVATQMLWHRDKWMSPALCAFLECAREFLA